MLRYGQINLELVLTVHDLNHNSFWASYLHGEIEIEILYYFLLECVTMYPIYTNLIGIESIKH